MAPDAGTSTGDSSSSLPQDVSCRARAVQACNIFRERKGALCERSSWWETLDTIMFADLFGLLTSTGLSVPSLFRESSDEGIRNRVGIRDSSVGLHLQCGWACRHLWSYCRMDRRGVVTAYQGRESNGHTRGTGSQSSAIPAYIQGVQTSIRWARNLRQKALWFLCFLRLWQKNYTFVVSSAPKTKINTFTVFSAPMTKKQYVH